MHEVGRTWAARHRITSLQNIFHFVPRSNDPGCSAGFGMGLTMYLGPELVADPRRALDTCAGLPTRFRAFTCVHGTGHALMRGYHGQLRYTVLACWKLGAINAPDCADRERSTTTGSRSAAVTTLRVRRTQTSLPRSVCGQYSLARPCWYRYFIERRSSVNVYQTDDIVELCRGLVRFNGPDASVGRRCSCRSRVSLLDHSLHCAAASPVPIPSTACAVWSCLRLQVDHRSSSG